MYKGIIDKKYYFIWRLYQRKIYFSLKKAKFLNFINNNLDRQIEFRSACFFINVVAAYKIGQKIHTTAGEVRLKVPKLKGVPFKTAIIENFFIFKIF